MDAAVARATSSLTTTRRVQPTSPNRPSSATTSNVATLSPPSSPLSTIATHPQPPQSPSPSPSPSSPLHHEFHPHNLPPPPPPPHMAMSPTKDTVARYKMSQARMKKLMDAWEDYSSSDDDDNGDEQQQDNDHSNDNDSQKESSDGIMTRASKWWSNRRQKLKQQTLKQQAEEQRQRILQQLSPDKQRQQQSSDNSENSLINLYCSHRQQNYTDDDDDTYYVNDDDAHNDDDHGLQLQQQEIPRSNSDTVSPKKTTIPKRGIEEAKSDTKIGELRSSSSGYGVTVDLSDVDLSLSAAAASETRNGHDQNDDKNQQQQHNEEEEISDDEETDQKQTNSRDENETTDENDDDDDDVFLAEISIQPEPPSKYNNEQIPFILTPNQMLQIAQKGCLPPSISYCKWKRIYSLARDGDSFDAFLRLVHKEQRTLLVVKTTKNDVFGGYADSAWEVMHRKENSGGFYGSAQACLFKVVGGGGGDLNKSKNKNGNHVNQPTKKKQGTNQKQNEPKKEVDSTMVQIYKWTGANRYIQLCDSSHKMIAFGGGGTDGTFGLTVSDDFRRGSTGYCDTFGNDVLCDCGDEDFEVLDLECWGFVTGVF